MVLQYLFYVSHSPSVGIWQDYAFYAYIIHWFIHTSTSYDLLVHPFINAWMLYTVFTKDIIVEKYEIVYKSLIFISCTIGSIYLISLYIGKRLHKKIPYLISTTIFPNTIFYAIISCLQHDKKLSLGSLIFSITMTTFFTFNPNAGGGAKELLLEYWVHNFGTIMFLE